MKIPDAREMVRAAFLFGVLLAAPLLLAQEQPRAVAFEELRGAKRLNPDSGCWEIAFTEGEGGAFWGRIEPVLASMGGIAYVKEGKWSAAEVEAPVLHFESGFWARGKAQPTVKEDGSCQIPAEPAHNGAAVVPHTFVNLPRGSVRDDACLGLTYVGRTGRQERWFPLYKEFASEDGSCQVAFVNKRMPFSWWVTKSCYVVQSNKRQARIIGRIPMDLVPYEGQWERSALPEFLAVVANSVRVVTKKTEHARSSDKIIQAGHLYGSDEYSAYECSLLGNTMGLFVVADKHGWAPVSLWDKRAKEIEGTLKMAASFQRDIDAFHKYGVRVILGVSPEWEMAGRILEEEFPQFRAEKLTADGKLVPVNKLDIANPEAVAFFEKEFPAALRKMFRDVDFADCNNETRFFRPYDYLGQPLYSQAALENYRRFLNNPDAKFPTASTVPATERTTNKPVSEDWKNYFAWRTRVKTDLHLMWARCEWNAFHGSSRYQGAWFIDAAFITNKPPDHGMDMERFFPSPHISVFVPEYVMSGKDPYFPAWRDGARANGKRLYSLFDDHMMYTPELEAIYLALRGKKRASVPEYRGQMEKDMLAIERNLVKIFTDAGVKMDVDGIGVCALCSPNQHTYGSFMKDRGGPIGSRLWTVWQALCRKHYGFGEMDLAQAERILDEIGKAQPGRPLPEGARRAVLAPAGKVIIDGAPDDWAGAARCPIEQTGGFKGWKGKADCSGDFCVSVDSDHLYFAAWVRDDVIVLNTQLAACPRAPWADEVDLYISTADLRREGRVWRGSNAVQLRFLPGCDKVWNTQAGRIPDSACAWRREAGGYFIEGRMSLRSLDLRPEPGICLALEAQLLDADDETGCRGVVSWNAFSGNRPEDWGIGIIE